MASYHSNDEITLREYVELHWQAHNKEHQMLQSAIDTAFEELNRRLEDMNNFRAQIMEERNTFLSKSEYDSRHRELEARVELKDKRIGDLELAKSNMDGRMWAAGAVLTILTVMVNLVFRYWGK